MYYQGGFECPLDLKSAFLAIVKKHQNRQTFNANYGKKYASDNGLGTY